MKKRTAVAFSILLAAIALAIFFIPESRAPFLVMEDRDTGRKWEYKLPGDTFSLGYVHSVMKTNAEEYFKAEKDGKIVLTETVYQSYGVGLPFLPEEGELTVRDGLFILKMHREFPDISMVISPLARHYLRIGEKKLNLSEILGEKSAKIRLSIKRNS
ncbi:MAG: DUF1850 domain-containing protein [Fusobacteriaceae bacterium]|jgi:hypothetical protein|nr:DUF1850 domain-containing protein [Fusobacteriaceae bacterium]